MFSFSSRSLTTLCLTSFSLSLTFVHLTSIFFQFQNCVPYLYSHRCIPTVTQFAKEMGFWVESLSTNGSVQMRKDWRAKHCQSNYRTVPVHFTDQLNPL